MVARLKTALTNDIIMLLHLLALFDRPCNMSDVPAGHPGVRKKISDLLEELNNTATSPGAIALQVARSQLGSEGHNFRQAHALLSHDHKQSTKQGAGHVPGPSASKTALLQAVHLNTSIVKL